MNAQLTQELNTVLQFDLSERIFIVEKLWQSILNEIKMPEIELTNTQKIEIDRRLKRIENGESELYSWKKARQIIEAQR